MKHIHKIINELKTQQEQLNLGDLQAEVLVKERDFNLKLQEKNTVQTEYDLLEKEIESWEYVLEKLKELKETENE